MLAGDLIDRISEVCGGYYSRAKLLTRANGEQNKLLGSNCAFMGRWVELVTVAGTFSYALPLVGTEFIRSLGGAFVSIPLASGCALVPTLRSPYPGSDNSTIRYKLDGATIAPADPVIGGGTVKFKVDPQGRTVFLKVYVWPSQLLTESDVVTLPEEFTGLLEISTTQLVYDRNYGNSDNLDKRFKSEKRAWSTFLSQYTETRGGRPAWGFLSDGTGRGRI